MAESFNLTAQIQLQAPSNTSQVIGQIQKQLKGVTVDVNVRSNARQVAQLNKELQSVNKAGQGAARSVGKLNSSLAQAGVRFSVIAAASGTLFAFTRSLKNSVKEAVEFEKELIKISQVTGRSVNQLKSLSSEVARLSTTLGTSSAELLNTSRILAQAGFSARQTKQALEVLAQTTLAATFENIQDTT